jgi:nucleoid-associated protein YgaU
MALARVVIETNKFQKKGKKEKIEASADARLFFNPNQYQLQRKVDWKEQKSKTTTPLLQFDKGGPRSLSLSLQFDTYGSDPPQDVRQLTSQIAKLGEIDSESGRPPVCTVFWGPTVDPYAGLPFTGVVEGITQKFTMFLADGTPVRATVDVQFKEGESSEKQTKRTPPPRGSPLQPKIRVVQQGDTLWSIAATEYGNPAQWRAIAIANRIITPRYLESGTVLLIPSME